MAIYMMLVFAKTDEDYDPKDIENMLTQKPDPLETKGMTTLFVKASLSDEKEFLEFGRGASNLNNFVRQQ